ncbi:MAG TPA: hypothetical protein V6D26_24885 [Stenomitos sp.]
MKIASFLRCNNYAKALGIDRSRVFCAIAFLQVKFNRSDRTFLIFKKAEVLKLRRI